MQAGVVGLDDDSDAESIASYASDLMLDHHRHHRHHQMPDPDPAADARGRSGGGGGATAAAGYTHTYTYVAEAPLPAAFESSADRERCLKLAFQVT